MLTTLEKVEPQVARRILSSTAATLLPSPYEDESKPQIKGYPSPEDVIAELRRKLNISVDDKSTKSLARLFDALSKEITRYSTSSESDAAIRNRLGSRGELPPRQYSVTFERTFDLLTNACGVRRSHIEDALSSPDQVQHLLRRNALVSTEFPRLSLYIKTFNRGKDPFTLLIDSERRGETQVVSNGWRVYHSDIDIPEPFTPLRLLKSFLAAFGGDFKIGDLGPYRFILYRRFPLDDSEAIKFAISDAAPNFMQQWHSKRKGDSVEVALCYLVDVDKYVNSMLAHNVEVDLKKAYMSYASPGISPVDSPAARKIK